MRKRIYTTTRKIGGAARSRKSSDETAVLRASPVSRIEMWQLNKRRKGVDGIGDTLKVHWTREPRRKRA